MTQITQSLALQQDVITGFSYTFAKALLEKLKSLRKEDNIFEHGEEKVKNGKSGTGTKPLATTIIHYLDDQTRIGGSVSSVEELDAIIENSEAFLAIFEIPNPSSEEQKVSAVENENIEPKTLVDVEKEMIAASIKKHRNRRKDVAAELGLSERTLYRKIKEYQLE